MKLRCSSGRFRKCSDYCRLQRCQLTTYETAGVVIDRPAVQLFIEDVKIAALQIAPVGIYLYLRGIQFAPDSLANVCQEIRRPVGGCTVNRLLLDQAADPSVVEEGGQHARLGCLHAIEDANGLDAAQDVWIHCE